MKYLIVLVLLISGCASLSTKPEAWRNGNGDLYHFNARVDIGVTGKRFIIYANGHEILRGKSHYWTNRVTMTGFLDGQKISASCTQKPKSCHLMIEGTHATILEY